MKAMLRRLFSALVIVLIVPLASTFSPAPALADEYQSGQRAAILTHSTYWNCTHIVRPSETLRRIAAHYHTTVNDLMQANSLRNPNRIRSGMSLRVPCAGTGDSQPCIGASYVVQPGDDLFRIGLRFGVRPRQLATFNGIRNPKRIFAGMRLAIPCVGNYAPQPGYPPPQPGYPPPQPPPTSPPTGGQVTVAMQNLAFNPPAITIRVGQTVVWRNDDSAPHTTTSGSCSGNVCTPAPGWDSGTLNTGQSFSHTFDTAGTFSYYCRIHGAMMQGTVVVMP